MSYQWFEEQDGVAAGLSFVIEGYDTVLATCAMPNAYSNDDAPYDQWTDPDVGELKVSGTISGAIKLYAPDIEADTVEVTVCDASETLISQLFRARSSAGNTTFLTSSVVAGSTSAIAVQSTTGFAASGTIYIGGERISYTGKTATTFTGITRAVYSANLCDDGSTRFSPSHLIGNNVTITARTAPAVTDYPRTWYGRFCHLFLHHKDPLTGEFSRPSEAVKVITGRIVNHRDAGDGSIAITIKSAIDLLAKPVGPDQWRAAINAGSVFNATTDTLNIARFDAAVYTPSTRLDLVGTYTHDQLASAVNAQFVTNVWDSGEVTAAGDDWRLELVDLGDGGPPRYRIQLRARTTALTGGNAWFGMHPNAMRLLGFESGTVDGRDATTGNTIRSIAVRRLTGSLAQAIADKPPVVYVSESPVTQPPAVFELTGELNTFVVQTGDDFLLPGNCNGVVQITGGKFDGTLCAVEYTSGTPSTIKVLARLNNLTGHFENTPTPWDTEVVRLGDPNATQPVARQVLYYRGSAGQLALRLMLSSGGTTGYNHSTYDTQSTAGYGAGIPSSLVDVASFESLDNVQIALVVGDPKPFYEYLEPILAVSNRYIVWKATDQSAQPKLTVVRPALDTAYQASWLMTENNKADNERTRVEHSAEGIINRAIVKYGAGVMGTKDSLVTLNVDDLPSQTDYGKRKTVTIDAGPVVNVPDVVATTLAPAFAYFTRPLATAERSFNASLMRMAPGDTVTLTDNYVVDAETGTRGATLYCWCLNTSFDLATGKGQARLIFLPEKDPNYSSPLAPSARVDETAPGGGYNVGTKTLTLRSYEFQNSTATTTRDAQRFASGDKVRVYSLDDAVPIEWFDEVDGTPTATTMTLLNGLALFDSAKRYIVEYDEINTVVLPQINKSFLASNFTTTYAAVSTPYEWGQTSGFRYVGAMPTIDYSVGMVRPSSTLDEFDAGRPASTHKYAYVVKGVNNHLGYRSRTVHINEYLGDQSQVGTTEKLVFMRWVPFYGHAGLNGTRPFVVRIRGRQSGGGTSVVTVASSIYPPTGDSYTAFTYPWGKQSLTFNSTSATNVWSSEGTLTAAPGPWGDVWGTWISVYVRGSAGGITSTINQLFVAEDGL